MHPLLLQLQLLLAALSALAPLLPGSGEGPVLRALGFVGQALSAGAAATQDLAVLAGKLKAMREEVEAIAVRETPLAAEELDAALERLRAASAAFRAALAER